MLICNTRTAFIKWFRLMMPVLLIGVAADQASKSWASLQAVEPRVLVPGYVAAYSVPNAGILLGVGNDQAQTSTVIALVGITYAGLVARFGYVYRRRLRGADWLAGALLLAGIFGNTIDRLAWAMSGTSW